MIRTIFAMAVAALVVAAVPGTSQAAPIAPLAADVIAGTHSVTPVYYYHRHYYHRHYYHRYYYHRHYYHRHWHHCWWRHGYRHCW
jgi:hypothetical protein